LGYSFPREQFMYWFWQKNGLGYILGYFVTDSSGHPGHMLSIFSDRALFWACKGCKGNIAYRLPGEKILAIGVRKKHTSQISTLKTGIVLHDWIRQTLFRCCND
jgi:hypothetical protein